MTARQGGLLSNPEKAPEKSATAGCNRPWREEESVLSQLQISHSSPSVSSHAKATRSESDSAPAASAASGGSPWPERESQLLQLYAEGVAPGEIARQMHLSPGSISGRLHRFRLAGKLPHRENPPRPNADGRTLSPELEARRRERIGEGVRRARARPAGSSPAAAPVPAAIAAAPMDARREVDSRRVAPVPAERPWSPPPAVRRAAASALAYGRLTTCCWPIGEPRTPGFRFCDDAAEPGAPYCTEHADLAWPKRRPAQQEAA